MNFNEALQVLRRINVHHGNAPISDAQAQCFYEELSRSVSFDEANAAVMGLTQAQYQEWTDLGREIQEQLEAAVQAGLSPKGEEGKEIPALHRRWLTITGNRYDPAKHRGIAALYVEDPRFTAYYDKQVPGCARFLRDAVTYWAKEG